MAVRAKSGVKVDALGDAAASDAAIGFRPHSGWSSLIAIAGPVAAPHVIERCRTELADRAARGTVQPYHFAEEMELKKAERGIEQCLKSSEGLALEAIEVT